MVRESSGQAARADQFIDPNGGDLALAAAKRHPGLRGRSAEMFKSFAGRTHLVSAETMHGVARVAKRFFAL